MQDNKIYFTSGTGLDSVLLEDLFQGKSSPKEFKPHYKFLLFFRVQVYYIINSNYHFQVD